MSVSANGRHVSASKKAAPMPESKADAGIFSGQLAELNTEMLGTLGRLNALIDSRGAWADGIEGCRAAAVLLKEMQGRLQGILGGARKIEMDLASARDEIERWNTMHADLSSVEGQLRTECARLKELNTGLMAAESELRTEMEKKQPLIDSQAKTIDNLRLLAEEMVREVGGVK